MEGEPSLNPRSDPMDEDVSSNAELPLSPQSPPPPASLTQLPPDSTTTKDTHRNFEITDFTISPPQTETAYEDAPDRVEPLDISQTLTTLPNSSESPLQNRTAPESVPDDFETPEFGQTIPPDQIVSFAEASRVLKGENQQDFTFTVILPSMNGGFYARRADRRNVISMLSALNRPLKPRYLDSNHSMLVPLKHPAVPEESLYLTSSSGKRLKLTPFIFIIEDAKTKHFKGVLKVPPA